MSGDIYVVQATEEESRRWTGTTGYARTWIRVFAGVGVYTDDCYCCEGWCTHTCPSRVLLAGPAAATALAAELSKNFKREKDVYSGKK